MFRIFVPGFGNIFVQGTNAQQAIQGALRYLEANNLSGQINPADLDNLQALPFSTGSLPQGALVVAENGVAVPGSGGPSATPTPTGTPAGTPTATATPTGGTGGPTPADGSGLFPAGPTPEQQAGGPVGIPIDPEEVSPFGAFRNFLQTQNLDPDSVLGSVVQRQYDPLISTFGLNQILHNLQGTINTEQGAGSAEQQFNALGNPQSFLDFYRQQGLGGASATALGALQGIAGNQGGGNTFLAALRGATPGSTFGNRIEDTARLALRQRLSPAALGLFGNQAFDLANTRYSDQLAGAATGGTQAPTYVEHLLRSLGLSA